MVCPRCRTEGCINPDEKSCSDNCLGHYHDVITAVEEARAAWIHHPMGPKILQALWKIRGPNRPCTHRAEELGPGVIGGLDHMMFTQPGVGTVGYAYCTVCGERKP